MQGQEFDTRPRRRFFEDRTLLPSGCIDDYGLLTPEGVAATSAVDDLPLRPAVLVIAHPWCGKTYVADALYESLRPAPDDRGRGTTFGSFIFQTSFHRFGQGSPTKPPWWDEWQAGDTRACWIVDAVDEEMRRDRPVVFDILRGLEEIDDAARQRLSLLLFCRKNEVPEEVVDKLQQLYPRRGTSSGVLRVELAPPDRVEAARIAGGDAALSKVMELINENSLGAVGAYPKIIERLARRADDAPLSKRQICREVLEDLLRGGSREVTDPSLPPLSDRFEAAERVAAVMAFSRLLELDRGLGESSLPRLDPLFSNDTPRVDQLRRAAQSLIHTPVLSQTATGYRFAEQHVQEWFAAFALERVSLNRLRPLLSIDDKPQSRLSGLIGILAEISEHEDVRRWITEIHGGVPPRSDTLPWTLQDAFVRLDHLQELARCSPWGLRFWGESGLENLWAPGLAEELVRRLNNPGLSMSEKDLLIAVSRLVDAREVAPVVCRIVQDDNEDDVVRSTASYTLQDLGGRDHVAALSDFARAIQPQTREQRVVVANVIRELLRHGLWSWREAYQHAPEPDPVIGDASSTVEFELKKLMAIDDARWLLAEFDWEQFSDADVRRDPALRVHHTHHGPLSFAIHAVDLLLAQEQADARDYELLYRVVLARDDGHLLDEVAQKVCQKASQDVHARQALFLSGLEQDPTRERNWGWRWQGVLNPLDMDWVLDIAESKAQSSPWLWEELLQLTLGPEVDDTTRERIREQVRSRRPEAVANFDRRRQVSTEREERWKREDAERRRQEEGSQYQLADLVARYLSESSLTSQQRLHGLSWICFPEDRFRPHNVTGRFEDLPIEQQQQVLGSCAGWLAEVQPTPIPDSNLYPAQIMYEAEAFLKVLRAGVSYALNGAQIRKWLPALMLSSSSERADVLARCMQAERTATEDVILATIRREMLWFEDGGSTAWNLPVEHWSERLVEKALEVVADVNLPLTGRCNLIRALSVRRPESTAPVAREWLRSSVAEAEDRRAMYLAAADVLVHAEPEEGMQALKHAVELWGKEALGQIGALAWHPPQPEVDFRCWSAPALEQLSVLLHQAFPLEHDPAPEHGPVWVSRDYDLRRLRGSIHPILFERAERPDLAALDRLAEQFGDVHDWYAWAQANKEASGVIDRSWLAEGALDWKEVVRLLEDVCYRLIRDSLDLQRALIEELHEIAKSAKQHLAMLYRSEERRQPRREGHLRQRQDEDALQAYLHARLADRLPGRVLHRRTQVFLNRETLAALNRKFDIKVEAPTWGGAAAAVVIEVKWSDNKQVSTSLHEQLGKRYLLGNDLTHGIYFVGWIRPGTWSQKAGVERPCNRDSIAEWEDAFERQARAFEREEPSVHISPVLVDLRWDTHD